ncbi:MAG: L,D-transpeptidase family protein [Clostridiales bacterium]|nr:L,D-transpeptidase family protein [Clostridiales bacterium]
MGKDLLSENKTNIITKRKLLFIMAGFFIILVISYISISLYYNTHFYMNTTINGLDISNMTAEQAEELIQEEFKGYSLNLTGRNDLTDQLHGRDINIYARFDGSLENLLDSQNGFLWISALFINPKLGIKTVPEYDEDLLRDLVYNLSYFQEENMVEPVNAYISEYNKDKGYEIIPEDLGAWVEFNILFESIKTAIDNLEPMISLEEIDCYKKPEIVADTPELLRVVNELNKIAGTEIVYEFGKDTEVLDGTLISKWLSVTEDYNVILDENGVKEYVDYIGKTYNSFGRTRTFKTSYGTTIKVKGGDYGWWLNRPLEVTELTELILAGEKVKKEPAYFQTAQQYGPDDIGNTYVEVSLKAQHLFFYKNGKLILETDIVSGNLAKGHGTPTGTFPIQYKERNATLNGEDYSTPVDYWMPFYRGIGFHDASWRSKFGGDIYKTKGSHGCINMPPKAAKILFEHIQRGVAVVVY